MLRNKNWVGVLGFVMLVFGVTTFIGDGNGYLPLWVAWLVAPLFWYGGFFVTVLWIVIRMVGVDARTATQPAKSGEVVELQPKRTFSNFLEHDCDTESQARKAAVKVCAVLTIATSLLVPALSMIAGG